MLDVMPSSVPLGTSVKSTFFHVFGYQIITSVWHVEKRPAWPQRPGVCDVVFKRVKSCSGDMDKASVLGTLKA